MVFLRMMKASTDLPTHVRLWMAAMVATFVAHGFFLGNEMVLISFVGFFVTAMILAPVGFALTGNINSMAVAHFVLWPAILANGAIRLFAGGETILSGPLSGPMIVLLLGYAVFLVSLALDFRIMVGEFKQSERVPAA